MERRTRRQYTADFKSQAASLAGSQGIAGAARKLGISAKTLANWVRVPSQHKQTGSVQKRPVSELEAELSRLRSECVFRLMPGHSSGPCRAVIPAHAGPGFRAMPGQLM